jgi:hypothetical protein
VHRVKTAFLVATVGTLAMAESAQAATVAITPASSCYLAGQPVTVSGSGYTAGGAINFTIDGSGIGSVTADASGNISGSFTFGRMNAAKQHTLTATDATNPALTAAVTYFGTTHQVATKKNIGKPGKKIKLRGYGFLFGPKAFLHVRGHGIKTDAFLARPKAPCGTFTVKKKLVPKGAPIGTYRVQFDAKKRFSKKTTPRLTGRVKVFPVAAGAFAGVAVNQAWTKLAR